MGQITPFRDGLYFLDDGRVRQFLFLEENRALLLDTGFPDSHVRDMVRTLTDKPVQVVLTHGDRDHAGGLSEFGACWLHPADWDLIPGGIQLHELAAGDIFSCAGYRLEVIETPGHTPGSVAFLDREHRLLFSGDTVQKGGPIYMFGPHRDLDAYIATLEQMLPLARLADEILPCHSHCPIDPGYIQKDLEDTLALRAGTLPHEKHPVFPCSIWHGKWTDFYY